jgi:signal transduction histidine kinase
MSSKSVFLLALIPLILIFGTQVFLVNDYYTTTRAAWIKESNTILEESFRKDLTLRNDYFRVLIDESTLVINSNNPSDENMAAVDFRKVKSSSVISIIDMAIHKHISTLVPLNLHQLDSVTATILETRKVNSKFTVNIVNNLTGELIEASKDNWRSSLFLISSERMLIDAENNIALQLHLINPFQIIIKRMGLMLASSLVLLIICLLIVVYLQKILDRQKKLVAFKNEFLGTIAHELKRPVSSLTFNLDCLSMSTTTLDTPQNELLLTNSIRATDELNESINMIVTLSKHEEGMLVLSRDTLDLPQLMEELKQKFIIPRFKNKQVSIQLQAEGSIPPVQGDRQLLSQCFSNLLDNAIKYSGEMVDIIIRFEIIDSMVATTIKDNGFGIPEDKLELVFDKYSRVHLGKTQIKGFGIGLNYVKSIVEKHKGEVRVSSKTGVGSEFSVLLPQ